MITTNKNIDLPIRIYLDITNACPLRCIHCYAYSGNKLNSELSITELKKIVEQMVELGILNLIISGGEPLVRKDLFDFLEFCRIKNINVTLLTSGILIEPKIAKLIKDLNISIRIGIDGISEESHDYIRGKGNFESILNALKILKEIDIEKLSIHFTINRINIDEILRLPYFLQQIGIRNLVISTIKPTGRAIEHPEIIIEPSLVLIIKERLNTISRSKFLKINTHKEKNWTGFACPAARVKCGITAEGNISPCVFLGRDYLGGNIKENSLLELWHNDGMLNRIRNINANKVCKDCASLDDFNGGCRARAIYYNKDIAGFDPYCCEIKKGREFIKEIAPNSQFSLVE